VPDGLFYKLRFWKQSLANGRSFTLVECRLLKGLKLVKEYYYMGRSIRLDCDDILTVGSEKALMLSFYFNSSDYGWMPAAPMSLN
jgi:hypothetical protein